MASQNEETLVDQLSLCSIPQANTFYFNSHFKLFTNLQIIYVGDLRLRLVIYFVQFIKGSIRLVKVSIKVQGAILVELSETAQSFYEIFFRGR